MTLVLREVQQTLRTAPILGFYVLVTLVVAAVVGLITVNVIDLGMTHFGQISHRTHDIAYGLLFATLVVGVAVQLWRPGRNVAAMAMALVPPAAMLLAGVLAGDVDAVVRFNPLRYAAWIAVVAALVHPGLPTVLRSVRIDRRSLPMAALVVVAAVPLLADASTNLRIQRTVSNEHSVMGHYGFMAALGFTVVAVGLLASLRLDGWRVPAWVAGLLPVTIGATSLRYPSSASSLETGWALAAVAWGIAFVVTAELTRRRETGPHLPSGTATRSEVSVPELS